MINQFWNRNRIVLKSFWIGFLILILLIPTFLISNLVTERQDRERESVAEISSRWAGAQTVTGPVIGIPYVETVSDNSGGSKPEKRWAYFLPGKLDISGRIVPEKRYRGIYKVIVYTTELQVRCHYDSLHLQELNLPADKMLWSEAAVFFNLSDLQGLQDEISLRLDTHTGGTDLELVPAKFSTEQFKNALTAALPGWLPAAAGGPLEFSTTVRMKGTGNLSFAPTGRETKVAVSSSWPDPSFSGSNLPDLRTVKDSGFVANWRVLALNRNFPQQWKGNTFDLDPASSNGSINARSTPFNTFSLGLRSVCFTPCSFPFRNISASTELTPWRPSRQSASSPGMSGQCCGPQRCRHSLAPNCPCSTVLSIP